MDTRDRDHCKLLESTALWVRPDLVRSNKREGIKKKEEENREK